MDDLTISVTIADRPYRLTIKRHEEEPVRKAAVEINAKMKYYAENFAFNDKQDLLAMVALEKTTEAIIEQRKKYEKEGEVVTSLDEIDRLLSSSIS
jgi:cell division protein ZapA (FtsZ GTPase activity inhibitor)